MSALQIPRPTGLRAAPYTATFSVRPTSAHRLVLARSEKFEKFEREEKPPPENLGNAAKEINHDTSKAGSNEADRDPLGGSGFEPPPADGEGQGYSMKEIAQNTNTDSRDGDTSSGTSSSSSSFSSMEEANVQDVE